MSKIDKGKLRVNTVKTPIEVRYQETDQMGVVYHANYLIWFEIGRTKFIESLGLSYAGMEKDGIVSPVIHADISFKRPVRYGDSVVIETWLQAYNGVRSVYGYQIMSNGELAVSGETEHVIVKKDTFRPISLKKAFPDWHKLYTANVKEV